MCMDRSSGFLLPFNSEASHLTLMKAYRTVYITNAEAPPYAVGDLSVAGVTTSFRITWSPSNG